jgi:polyisoprenoid-binding protein YceI
LTFLGVTKPVTLDVTFNKALGQHPFANKPALGFTAEGSLKRSEFGMDTYIPQIGDEVDFIIQAEFFYAG